VENKGLEEKMVGAIGFEPTTPCAQGRCATRLRYAPTVWNNSLIIQVKFSGAAAWETQIAHPEQVTVVRRRQSHASDRRGIIFRQWSSPAAMPW
jgi:hypothetical protein